MKHRRNTEQYKIEPIRAFSVQLSFICVSSVANVFLGTILRAVSNETKGTGRLTQGERRGVSRFSREPVRMCHCLSALGQAVPPSQSHHWPVAASRALLLRGLRSSGTPAHIPFQRYSLRENNPHVTGIGREPDVLYLHVGLTPDARLNRLRPHIAIVSFLAARSIYSAPACGRPNNPWRFLMSRYSDMK